ncbi:Kazal-type serine protease inhibitor domain-containing [Micractinium conductrix]|uniref:Kazal-type serine protease inhibitor domain-containing n=1 Tax=Micractinium conductrix TaxID=554055 RepID=A0A2P6V730_9CHLO|nr:Kazal-type serine protease inhibitor domain-containing [Micractinium conductrix]|eukprot:PSC69897.1 Kazal-type serine protease inhibitor domain-containing [Micractinium conductrix]
MTPGAEVPLATFDDLEDAVLEVIFAHCCRVQPAGAGGSEAPPTYRHNPALPLACRRWADVYTQSSILWEELRLDWEVVFAQWPRRMPYATLGAALQPAAHWVSRRLPHTRRLLFSGCQAIQLPEVLTVLTERFPGGLCSPRLLDISLLDVRGTVGATLPPLLRRCTALQALTLACPARAAGLSHAFTLEGAALAGLGCLPQLASLDLLVDKMGGSTADVAAALPGLTRLCLRCRMESAALAPELLEGLSQLRRLELDTVRVAQFTPRLAQALAQLTHLACTDVLAAQPRRRAGIQLWVGLRHLASLRELRLERQVGAGLPANALACRQLQGLTLLGCEARDWPTAPYSYTGEGGCVGSLASLHLESLRLAAPIPFALWKLLAPGLMALTWRSVRRGLNGVVLMDEQDLNEALEVPQELAYLTSLRELRLEYARLDGLPPAVQALTRLTRLSLEGNRVAALPLGQYLTGLQALSLANCQLEALPEGLAACSRLRDVSLASNAGLAVSPAAAAELSRSLLHLERLQDGVTFYSEDSAVVVFESLEAANKRAALLWPGMRRRYPENGRPDLDPDRCDDGLDDDDDEAEENETEGGSGGKPDGEADDPADTPEIPVPRVSDIRELPTSYLAMRPPWRVALLAAVLLAAAKPGSAFRPADPLPPSDCSCNDKVSAVVCGSSGRLFDNSCRLECAQEQLLGTCGERSADECARVCRGAAKPPPPDGSMCIDLWAPVCGKAGGVFANKCVAEASQVEVRSACGKLDDEQCRLDCFAQAEDPGDVIDSPEPPPCPCTKEWAPGTACEGKCAAEVAGVATCVAGCPPTFAYMPECGASGRMFDGNCQRECAADALLFTCANKGLDARACKHACCEAVHGSCAPPPPDCGSCPAEFDAGSAGCGYGGMFFPNSCLAECAGAALNPATACSADESMKACASRCGDDPLPPELKCDCSDPAGSAAALGLTGAVCGSDGLVYPELCTLRCKGGPQGTFLLGYCPFIYSLAGGVGPSFVSGEPRDLPGSETPVDDEAACQQSCAAAVAPVEDPCAACYKLPEVQQGGERYHTCGVSGLVHSHPCLLKCNGDRPLEGFSCEGKRGCKAACADVAALQADGGGGCMCVALHAPVCAASGKVFPNACAAECARDEWWFECGRLPPGLCETACRAIRPVEALPGGGLQGSSLVIEARAACAGAKAARVCAKSGNVYKNDCLLKASNATKMWPCGQRKKCSDACISAAADKPGLCAAGDAPVCATSGKVVATPCALKAAGLKNRFACGTRNNCRLDCSTAAAACPKPGSTVAKPVCAINGVVYASYCAMKKAKAKRRFTCEDRFDCKDDCRAAANPNKFCGCSTELKPVCTQWGGLFTNACRARCAKRRVRWPCGRRGAKRCAAQCVKAAKSRKA